MDDDTKKLPKNTPSQPLTQPTLRQRADMLAKDTTWDTKAFRKRKQAQSKRLKLTPAQREKIRDSQLSQRERKQGVRTLRNKPGWDPHTRVKENLHNTLQHLDQEVRSEKAYNHATQCDACTTLQERSDDPSALCDQHLAQAMGF